MNGIGTKNSFFLNGITYSGQFKNGLFDGVGRATYPNGSVYIGEWRNNNPNGKGILFFADSNVQKGLFKDGKFKLAFEFKNSDLF